jgi:ATP diphosphatase
MAKIQEEIQELEIEHKADNRENISEEIGDILFTLVNLTRHFNLDPEDIMRKSNLKFENRFRAMENYAKDNNIALDNMSLEELEEIWQKIK